MYTSSSSLSSYSSDKSNHGISSSGWTSITMGHHRSSFHPNSNLRNKRSLWQTSSIRTSIASPLPSSTNDSIQGTYLTPFPSAKKRKCITIPCSTSTVLHDSGINRNPTERYHNMSTGTFGLYTQPKNRNVGVGFCSIINPFRDTGVMDNCGDDCFYLDDDDEVDETRLQGESSCPATPQQQVQQKKPVRSVLPPHQELRRMWNKMRSSAKGYTLTSSPLLSTSSPYRGSWDDEDDKTSRNESEHMGQVWSYKDVPEGFFTKPTSAQYAGFRQNKDILRAVSEGNVTLLRQYLHLQNKDDSLFSSTTASKADHHDRRGFFVRNPSDGKTLLHLAVHHQQVAVVQFLLKEAHISVQVHDHQGRTPLHDAVLSLMETQDANVTTTTSSKDDTTLQNWRETLSKTTTFALVDLILEQCPDLLWIRDQQGHSPLEYAKPQDWNSWCQYLKSKGIKALVPRSKLLLAHNLHATATPTSRVCTITPPPSFDHDEENEAEAQGDDEECSF
ncbi:hypothetical protein ACA910_008690 [Epithemia clementina (nom. ined.)]